MKFLPAILLAMTTTATIAHAQDKARFPKPAPEKAFAEYKIVRNGDVLRTPREDWDGAKLRVKNDAEWKKWLGKERSEVDDWMTKRADRVEWVAGWYHDFVSPKNGARLTWTPDIPTENSLVSSSDANEHVALTPKLFGAWVYSFRAKNGDMMERAAKLYRLTDDKKYGDWVSGQLDFYADNYEKWPLQPDKGLSRLTAQALDDAVLLTHHLNAARALGTYVTPAKKAQWIEKLFHPQAELLSKSTQIIHNIATWQRSATAQVGLYAKDDALWKTAIDGKFGIRAQLAQGVTGDYLWYEQSLGYNSYLLSALQDLFTNALLDGRGAELKGEMHIAQNLMLAPLAIRFVNGQLPTPADSARSTAPNRGFLASQYRIFPTTIGLQQAAKTRSWDTLIDPPPAPQVLAGPELAPVVSRDLSSSRMALLRGPSWQVWFHYGQLTNSHAQSEALNFEAFWNDFDVTHDAGTVGYGSPLHTNYYRRGLAHNALLVDGEGQESWSEGELLKFDAKNLIVSAAQPKYRPNAKAARTLQIEGDALRDVATIETTDGKEHSLGLALQLQGEIQTDGVWKDAAVEDFAEKRPKSFTYWKPLGALENKREISFVVEVKNDAGKIQAFRVTMKSDSAFRAVRADVPDAPPQRRAAVLLETRGEKATFTTTIEAIAQ